MVRHLLCGSEPRAEGHFNLREVLLAVAYAKCVSMPSTKAGVVWLPACFGFDINRRCLFRGLRAKDVTHTRLIAPQQAAPVEGRRG